MREIQFDDIGTALPRRGNAFSRWLGGFVLRCYGIKVVGALPNVPKMILLGAPHTSNIDGVITIAAAYHLGLSLSVMVKDSAFNGAFGRLLRWLGCIAIDRKQANGVVGSMIDAFNQRDQLILAIAPEGTRSGAEKWKSGFYHVAMGANVPVVTGSINYITGVLHFSCEVPLTGDRDADLPQLVARYKDCWPRHPTRVSKPIAELLGIPWLGKSSD